MKTMSRLVKRYILFSIFLILVLFPLLFPSLPYAAMTDYCQTPPFIVGGIKPNLLLMLDNSASMYDLSYIAGTFTTPPTVSCTGGGISSTQMSFCYDTTYDNTRTYVGYFDPAKKYRYSETPSDNGTTPGSNDKYVEVGSIPSSCNYGGASTATPYVCIDKSGTGTTADPYKITNFYATGNFLNWLSSSKFDVQKEVLTGGKYDTTDSLLIGESRGCNGRRFVKEVSGLGVTFAMRGPSALEPDYVNPDTQGGLSRIEIYIGTNANMGDCQCAIANWIGGNYGQAKTQTANCLGVGNTEINAYNQIMQDCWTIKTNIANGQPPFGPTGNNPSFNSTQVQCLNVYTDICGSKTSPSPYSCSKTSTYPTTNPTSITGAITNENSGTWQCTSAATHLAPADPYDDYGTDTLGFVGRCVTSFYWQGNNLKANWDDACTQREILHYCYGSAVSEVVDPSEGAADTTQTGNIPSILMDSSVRSLGTPAGTFYIRVASSAPTGLIQEFSSTIRFGAMSFNCIGSATETTLKPICRSGSNYDAGKIIHYIGYVGGTADESVGSHSSGLINTIDALVAESWTPFSEAYYNAIGYFARTNAYPVSPGTSRTDLRINSTDFVSDKNPSQYRCQQNHILLITDGMSTADQRSEVNTLVTNYYNDGDGQTGWSSTCPEFAGSKNLDDLAWLAKNRNVKTFSTSSASTTVPAESSEYITTRVVYTGSTSSETLECNPITLMEQTALNGCGYSDSTTACYQRAEASNLEQSLRNALETIAAQASSGTAASVLASGEGSGANLIQALFYPERKQFGSTTIDPGITWTGSLRNLWYYMDPFFTNSIIMDDSTSDNILNLSNDCSITFTIVGGTVKAIKGGACAAATIDVDNISTLWEAGLKLFQTNPSDRTIYTTTDGTTRIAFTTPAAATLQTLLQALSNQNLADRIISYVRGTDYNSKFCSSTVATSCTVDADCPAGETCINYRNRTLTLNSMTNTWKLGDIISSTPKIVSWTPLNGYYKTYNDQSYKTFTESSNYTSRGMVFVGANDGMLHAFKLGDLVLPPPSTHSKDKHTFVANEKAYLGGSDLGKEIWAFIPKNALPYLGYMADANYCHIYSIDATPYIFDASVGTGSTDISDEGRPTDGSTWRTILIGGMRLGGACKSSASTYGVLIPAAGIGYSSYFALDITDPNNPTILWEFSHSDLGFSTTGPAVVRIGNQAKNGKWFVVFGSGPTGPIDTGSKQFKGYSDQPLKLFVFDVKQGPGSSNANVTTITPSTAINYAFAGAFLGSPIDIHQNNTSASGFYQDDALYFGYTQSEDSTPTSSTKWTKGGVLRLLTKEDPDPSSWALSTVISNIGPVTAEVAKLQNYKYSSEALWLYFGTGRYYYKSSSEIDDGTSQRKLYGIKDPCFTSATVTPPGYSSYTSCTTAVSEAALGAATTAAGSTDSDGWYIALDLSESGYSAERVIAAPSSSSIGAVFFTTAKPSSDICSYGGGTHLWAIDYDTGGKVSTGLLKGKALIQASGSIVQIDLSTAFPEDAAHKEGRRSAIISGLAVASPPVIVPLKAMKRIIHMRER